jgi:hypothetical protein
MTQKLEENICKPYIDNGLISKVHKVPNNSISRKQCNERMGKGLTHIYFSKGNIKSLIYEIIITITNIRQTQTKTIIINYLTSYRMTIIKNGDRKYW